MTSLRITANLPSRDFDVTLAFYDRLGFSLSFRNDAWMILTHGSAQIEFFPHPDLVPTESWFSACIRVADVDALHARWDRLNLPDKGEPRLTPVFSSDGAPRMFALVDPDGNLWRILQET